ncbi:hypothetical protein M440DRAFT_1045271 [Trichoderma longibrachiatum ATCC 18648]|uniref:Uncharacterized protein n=1 Tax=Trichoderma longibrachiatum ATCC 18648 TaxID=983965 RepID=A0A2T4BYP7_TRILO|nr:hypothetical protein M440DRAFT_1045271 [Trichoderma longibrachiatum ATCC 18648]
MERKKKKRGRCWLCRGRAGRLSHYLARSRCCSGLLVGAVAARLGSGQGWRLDSRSFLCSFPWVVFCFSLSLSTNLRHAIFCNTVAFVVLRISPSLAILCSPICCESAAFASNRRGRGQSLSY